MGAYICDVIKMGANIQGCLFFVGAHFPDFTVYVIDKAW